MQEDTALVPDPGNPPRSRRWLVALGTVVLLGGSAGVAAHLYRQLGAEQRRRAQLEEQHRSLSDALELHRASKAQLDTRLTTCLGELDTEKTTAADSGAQLNKAEAELTVCQSSMSDLKAQKAQSNALLEEFRTLTGRLQNMIDTGQLDVEFRRGQMVVKLPAQVLFPSGSATISDQGRAAVRGVADVFKSMPGRRFTVAGHTDNVPVRGGAFPDNWALSTARAVTVTLELINAGVRPTSLSAAGFGQYAPVASNRSEVGRSRNRRIEIILEPDLRKLPLDAISAGPAEKKRRRGK
jgi:chemotaxis protein MotB